MPRKAESTSDPALAMHGATRLPAVRVKAYSVELRDADGGLTGDRASRRAFQSILADWRERLRAVTGEDPLGNSAPDGDVGKKRLEKILAEGDPEAAALVLTAIEDFSQELVTVVRRLMRLKEWRETERIAVGGGLRGGRVGELAIARATLMLRAEGRGIDLRPIRHHPDEAGLIGCAHLAPPWVFGGHSALLGVDIGGTNIRAGAVELKVEKAADLSAACVWESEVWRHADETPKREDAVGRIAEMLRGIVTRAEKKDLLLAPFIGIGCPGLITTDGSIESGGQNLPGNWEAGGFNLPRQLRELVGTIGGYEPAVVMHNDAVVQGLSEVPFMQDVKHWGVLTIGTGLGNACFGASDRPKQRTDHSARIA